VRAIREVFKLEFFRKPTQVDLEKQLRLDCMHYCWKNCSVGWQGSFTNKDRNKLIILEAIADQRLWIWYAYFGLLGSNNDLNVLDKSFFI
jgi:hypothetical protein